MDCLQTINSRLMKIDADFHQIKEKKLSLSEAKFEAIQEQVNHLLTLGKTFHTTLSSKKIQANEMQNIEFKAKSLEQRLAKLYLACTPTHPPAELQDKIHSALGDITTRLSKFCDISFTAAELLTNQVDIS